MFRNLSLHTISVVFVGVLTASATAFFLFYAAISTRADDALDSWRLYQADRSDKARLEGIIRGSMGYGGMIHEIKDFVISRDRGRITQALTHIGAARAAVAQYRTLELSRDELMSVSDIEETLGAYQARLESMLPASLHDLTATEVDRRIRVDDTYALRAFDVLRAELHHPSIRPDNVARAKGRLVADMRAALGYGGMIHGIKNVVIRYPERGYGSIDYAEQAFHSIALVRDEVEEYTTLGTTDSEAAALADIATTVAAYEERLTTFLRDIVDSSGPGSSETGADEDPVSMRAERLRVDDTHALRALGTLDRAVAEQIRQLSVGVDDNLEFLANRSSFITIGILLGIMAAATLSAWIFHALVVKRVEEITSKMNRLADEDLSVDITGIYRTNEMGDMARALQKFKENIVVRQETEERIRELAATDPLTGLDNRRRFDEHLEESIRVAKRLGRGVACALIDLDDFKPINDTYGHAAGDAVLVEIAERLGLLLRDTDYAARLGGDEFAVLVTMLELDDLSERLGTIGTRLLEHIRMPMFYEDTAFRVSGSIGIAVYPAHATSPEMLKKKADAALYEAKRAGRNRVMFADG